MNTIKKILGIAATLTALAAAGTAHATREYATHGSACMPAWGSTMSQLRYADIGVANFSSTDSVQLTCPGVGTGTSTGNWVVTTAKLMVLDLSSSQPLSCSLFSLDIYGWAAWGPAKFSCSQYGGCNAADVTSSYMGHAWIELDASSMWSDSMLGYTCTVPPIGAGGSSWIEDMVSVTPQP